MDGFKRPRRPSMPGNPRPNITRPAGPMVPPRPVVAQPAVNLVQPASPSQPQQNVDVAPQNEPLPQMTIDEPTPPARPKRRHTGRNIFLCVFVVLVVLAGLAVVWYKNQLKPADSADATGKDFTVKQGDTVGVIAGNLKQLSLIRNEYAFQLHARLTGQTTIAEGNCVIKASETPDQILAQLAKGCNEFKTITFYPGATIEKPLYKPTHAQGDLDTMYIKFRLQKAGYSDAQIEAALNKQYSGPLFADKPAGTTLEGYVYGETYHVDTTASADKVLQTTFDQMYKDITANDLINKFKAQGLNLYQGITMSSIVQRELNCEGKVNDQGVIDEARTARCYGYQQTIAQVFLKRYKENGTLGSDVTFIYAADMKGVTPSPDLDSAYNTRIHAGLPPGPIASPGLLAMKSVGNPTATDYNFFIAGDDGLIYFARTLKEHEANIAKYCKILCNDL